MRILIIHNFNLFVGNDAGNNRWRSLVEGLLPNGVEIFWVITQGYRSTKELNKYKKSGKAYGVNYTYISSILNNSLLQRRISNYLISPLTVKLVSIRVCKLIRIIKPDFIWLNQDLNIFKVYFNFKYYPPKKPKLLIELSEFDEIGLTHAANRLQIKQAKEYSNVLLYRLLPKVDGLIVMTKVLLEYYKPFTSASKSAFLHLPMTVDFRRFKKTDKKQDTGKYIAYCGSPSFSKDGVDILIKSCVKIFKTYPDLILKIAGPIEDDSRRMFNLIAEVDLTDKIHYIGEISRDEIPNFLNSAYLLALPRPQSKQAEGGFPTKLGEYLASSVPVCVTRVGEIPNYLEDEINAFVAEPGSVDSFANAMFRALSDRAKAISVGLAGKQVAEINFNMELQGKTLFKFLETILKKD